MNTDNPDSAGPNPASLKQLTDYTDAELIIALDEAAQHITGKTWTVTAIANEMIRRANEKDGTAA